MWPETIAGSLVSAVACGRETNSKERKRRRWEQQKKTFNICCLKAASLLPLRMSLLLLWQRTRCVHGPEKTLHYKRVPWSKPKQRSQKIFLLFERLWLCVQHGKRTFHLTKRCVHFAHQSSLSSAISSHRQTLCMATILLLYLMNNLEATALVPIHNCCRAAVQ